MPQAIPIAIAVASAGATIYGQQKQQKASKEMARATQQQIAEERKAEALRQRAMELDARRRSMEVIRQQQRNRSLAVATATAQGLGSGSSGLYGGFGQISGQSGVNAQGIQQNLEIGRQLFDVNNSISGARIDYARAGSDLATGQAFSQLGGTLMQLGPQISSFAAGFGPRSYGTGNPGYYGQQIRNMGRGPIY